MLAFPRPAIDIPIDPPDIAELGRWPLTVAEHPALEPHFAIAAALAEPGVTWTDLCARGAQHRHMSSGQELVDYLDAWCSVIAADYGASIEKLGHVRHASNARLVRALKEDVSALAAAHGPAHDLESFLRTGGFLDVEQVDLVAAAYFEVGKLEDAAEANALAETMDVAPTEKIRCTRLLRQIADTTGGTRDEAIAYLKLEAVPTHVGLRSPRCHEEYDQVRCWKDRDCNAYWADVVRPAEASYVSYLARVYQNWGRASDYFDWYDAARQLIYARPFHDRYILLLPAIDLALRTSPCSQSSLGDIQDVARLGLDDLGPTRVRVQMTRDEVESELARNTELATLKRDEVVTIRRRLEATRATAKSLEKLDPAACRKALAALPPVQP